MTLSVVLFGWLAIGSLMMMIAWGRVLKHFDASTGSRLWSKEWMIAAALTLHAGVMVTACAYRIGDFYISGAVIPGGVPVLFEAILTGLFVSKAMLVWAGATKETERRVGWPWWAFLVAIALWAGMVLL